MLLRFRNGPLYRDALEVILQVVSLIYWIRCQISVVFNIAGPFPAREHNCSGNQ